MRLGHLKKKKVIEMSDYEKEASTLTLWLILIFPSGMQMSSLLVQQL